ncbi:MAG: radical SAM protein [Candidatus Woesearchaeota archaeon]
MKVEILGLAEGMSRSRMDSKTLGEQYAFVLFGRCNFRCGYCFMGGYETRQTDSLPGAKIIDLDQVIGFVDEQIGKAHPIRLTGGEPTLFPDAITILAQHIKAKDGYLSIATNGSNPDIVERLFPYLDEISVGIKATPPEVKRLTGAAIEDCWYKPLELFRRLKAYKGNLQVNQVVTESSRYEEVEQLAKYIPTNASWRIKPALAVRHELSLHGEHSIHKSNHFKEITRGTADEWAEKLQRKHPHLKIISTGSEIEKRLKQ